MPNNYHEDTSYKYRLNQKELLGKILSGTLDEDLYIDKLILNARPSSDWRLNPVFTGRCFSGKHKLHIGIEWTAADTSYLGQNSFASLFSGIVNVTHLYLNIKHTGTTDLVSMPLTAFCRYAVDLVQVEICGGNNIHLGSFHCAFMDVPTLKTLILRSFAITSSSNYFINNSGVDVIVLDSPSVATLGDIRGMNNVAFAQGGTGGTIYIPKSLYDHLGDGSEYDYKSSTNWSTIDSYGTITWAQIEGSEYEL